MVTGFALQALSPQLDLQNKTEHHAWIHCALPALPISRAFMRSLSMHTLSPEQLQCSISPVVFISVPCQDVAMHKTRSVVGICAGDFIRHL